MELKSAQNTDFRYKTTVIPLYQNDGYYLAQAEGFVLEFCKASQKKIMKCFAKFFGHRSRTRPRRVLSLRSNPLSLRAAISKNTQALSAWVLFDGAERGIRTLVCFRTN